MLPVVENLNKDSNNHSSEDENTTQIYSKQADSEYYQQEIKRNLEISSETNDNESLAFLIKMVKKIGDDFTEMKKGQDKMIAEVKEIKEEVKEIKEEVKEIKEEVKEIKEEVKKIKEEVKDLTEKFWEESIITQSNFVYSIDLLDFQFEITARWKIGRDYGIEFSNLYRFDSIELFQKYFNSVVPKTVIKEIFGKNSKFKNLEALIEKLYEQLISNDENRSIMEKYKCEVFNLNYMFWSVFNILKFDNNNKFSKECEINIGGKIDLKNLSLLKIHLGEIKLSLDWYSNNKAIQQVCNPLNFLSEILYFGSNGKYTIERYAYIYYGKIKENFQKHKEEIYDKEKRINFKYINITLNNK